jgi:hypothetical protein
MNQCSCSSAPRHPVSPPSVSSQQVRKSSCLVRHLRFSVASRSTASIHWSDSHTRRTTNSSRRMPDSSPTCSDRDESRKACRSHPSTTPSTFDVARQSACQLTENDHGHNGQSLLDSLDDIAIFKPLYTVFSHSLVSHATPVVPCLQHGPLLHWDTSF